MDKQKGFIEGRPVDEWQVPIPTAAQVEARRIENERIAQEQAVIRQGFDSQPTAGHSRDRDAEVKQLQEAWTARAERAITMPRRERER